MNTNDNHPAQRRTDVRPSATLRAGTGMKSYQMLNRPLAPVAIMQVARVAGELSDLGFTVLTAQFGEQPSITIKPNIATTRFVSVCTGQGFFMGRMCKNYAAIFSGIKLVWHKPMKLLH